MNNRLLFRIPIFYNDKFLGFEYHNIETGQVLTDIKDKTDCENWKFGDWEQCTGLKDINGNLIYENDVIKETSIDEDSAFGRTIEEISIVCFGGGDYSYSFTLKNQDFYHGYKLLDNGYMREEIEIISNIHKKKEN